MKKVAFQQQQQSKRIRIIDPGLIIQFFVKFVFTSAPGIPAIVRYYPSREGANNISMVNWF
jgi:hypothetical protein